MGVIRPPWVSKEWFSQCPFNYCDHFGEKKLLAAICKICKDEIKRLKLYKRAGKDPYDMKNVFSDIGKDLAKALAMVTKKAQEMGIDIDNLPDEPEPPPHESYPIFIAIEKYAKRVEKSIRELQAVSLGTNFESLIKAINVFSHSRYYIVAKIGRALSSRWEEAKDPQDDLDDSKTSAFLAYIAIDRNSKAFLSLAQQKPLMSMRIKYLKLAELSLSLCELIRDEFFPDDKLEYEEFGYYDFR
ncbi:MAG: hypothetical protein HYW62_04465 [Candidatus Levybacteria bacterium]|nr:hypothetical protein [Candidatus Levybacteria bacterium]